MNRGLSLHLSQHKALMKKLGICLLRKWSRLIAQFIVPVLVLSLCVSFTKEGRPAEKKGPNGRFFYEFFIIFSQIVISL